MILTAEARPPLLAREDPVSLLLGRRAGRSRPRRGGGLGAGADRYQHRGEKEVFHRSSLGPSGSADHVVILPLPRPRQDTLAACAMLAEAVHFFVVRFS